MKPIVVHSILVFLMTVLACGGEVSTAPSEVTTVTVTPASTSIASVGETIELSAVASNADGNVILHKSFTWATSDTSVAAVNTRGTVTAVANGLATITATTEGVAATATITVAQQVVTMEVVPAWVSLVSLGETLQLAATAFDARGNAIAGEPFTWTTSDESLATVNTSGLVTAIAPGSASIVVAAVNLSDTARITVFDGEPQGEQEFELVDGVGITMVWIPAGDFFMGSPVDEFERHDDEGPVHRVTIPHGFWMSRYELTQGQWEAVVDTNPAQDESVGANYPVYNVSWDEIHEFLEQIGGGFRLPSEAEWEYAARAGTQTRFYWGDDFSSQDIGDYAVYHTLTGWQEEVGTKQANAWGLYDMSGNVWEWVEDDYHPDYEGAPTNGSAWVNSPTRYAGRVLRSGWADDEFYPGQCRSANRAWTYATSHRLNVGFRLVLP